MKKMISLIACTLALVLMLTTCGQQAPQTNGQSLADGGVLILSVNPKIAVEYDENGLVTGVTARNDDALAIINKCTNLIGKNTKDVLTDLVTAIGNAGYFVEEIEGQRRQITLEIEPGSRLPSDTFLDDAIAGIREVISRHNWSSPLMMEGYTDYGITDYIDTDYGVGNDGITDYNDTDYGPNNDGVTDYIDTDYGPNNDGVTDYIDTDYGVGNDGITDYNDTDYGPNNDGVTDYIDTDYGVGNDGVTDYYGGSDYDGNSNYDSDSRYGNS